MREATRLLIENGIIPESVVRLCQVWGGDSQEVSVGNRAKTQEELASVVRKVAELLEADALPEIKETELDLEAITKKGKTIISMSATSNSGMDVEIKMCVGFTPAGKMVVKVDGQYRQVERVCQKGNVITVGGLNRVITHVEPRYVGDQVGFYVCDLEMV
jgi:hypothetical protein